MFKWIQALSSMATLAVQIERLVRLFEKDSDLTEEKRPEVLQAVILAAAAVRPFTKKLPSDGVLWKLADEIYTALKERGTDEG